jgi:hypothetical protein
MRFRTRTAVSWSYHLDDVGVPNEIAVEPAHDRLLRDALPPSPPPAPHRGGHEGHPRLARRGRGAHGRAEGRGSRQLARRGLRGSLVTRASFEADVGTRGHWSASVMGGGFRA